MIGAKLAHHHMKSYGVLWNPLCGNVGWGGFGFGCRVVLGFSDKLGSDSHSIASEHVHVHIHICLYTYIDAVIVVNLTCVCDTSLRLSHDDSKAARCTR